MLATLLLTLAAAPAAPEADTVTVTLPLEAYALGTEIELGELAALTGPAALVAELEDLELGYAPAPGYSRLLRVGQVRAALARKAPEVAVRIVGQQATRVWPAVEDVAADDLRAAARDALARHLGAAASDLEPLDALQGVQVPRTEGGATLRARIDGEAGETTSVAVEVLVEDALYRTVWTRWRAERWVEVPVLVRAVAAGETLTPAHFEWRRLSVAGTQPEALAPEAAYGASAVRALEAGATVRLTDIRRAFAVRAGANLVLTVKKGAIEARVPAVALEAAALGGRLRVRTTTNEQELTATLLTPDQAVIELGR